MLINEELTCVIEQCGKMPGLSDVMMQTTAALKAEYTCDSSAAIITLGALSWKHLITHSKIPLTPSK